MLNQWSVFASWCIGVNPFMYNNCFWFLVRKIFYFNCFLKMIEQIFKNTCLGVGGVYNLNSPAIDL